MKLVVTMLVGIAALSAGNTVLGATDGDAIGPQEIIGLGATPSVSISNDADQVRIIFQGALQVAESVTGPWIDLTNATNPYQPAPTGQQQFYRARTPDSIFSSPSEVILRLRAPFQHYFDLAYAGSPDGIFPPVRQKPYFDGTLEIAGMAIPVSLRVRGNSSLQECPFPKLKFKVSRDHREGTPFFDAREVKIGTHCAEGGRGTIGRLREQIATFREALAYEAMDLLGFVTPRVRRAQIQYQDTTPTNASPDAGWQVMRQAVILDDAEVVAERLGGRALDDEEIVALTNANFNAQLITDLRFLHALLGNWDYKLSVDGRELWNTDVLALPDGTLHPLAGDFDLASWVTGVVRVMAPRDYYPELPDVDREARYQLEQTREQMGTTHFAAARDRFVARRTMLEAKIGPAELDEPGRTNALLHVTAFYNAVEAVSR